MRRRQFLERAATLSAVGTAATVAVFNTSKTRAESTMPLPVIDTHQHLWDLSKFKLPWQVEAPTLSKDFLPSDYLAAIQGKNVVQTVYMEVDVEVSQQNAEADYVLDLCERDDNPMAAAVISGRPADSGFAAYMKRFEKNDLIKGIRQVLHGESTPAGYCLAPAFVKGIQHLGAIGKSFDLCMRSSDLLDADKLVAQCPQTRFIVDHCGNMDPKDKNSPNRQKWLDGMRALAQRPNVVCKVSGIIASAPKGWTPADLAPVVLDTIKTFGIDRSFFAGDWPVCTLGATLSQWIDCLAEIVRDFPEADRRKLFHDNAKRLYGLGEKKWNAPSA